jgi:hypothetical protein
MKRNMMVGFHQICYGEDPPASNLFCKDGNVPNLSLVGDCPNSEGTIVAIGSSVVFFVGDKVEGRSPDIIVTS